MCFLAFLNLVTLDLNTLLSSLQPPLERRGEVVFGQCPYDPLTLRLKIRPTSSLFSVRNKKNSAGAKSEGGGDGEATGYVFQP
jgi:hypothetical protein